MRTLLLVTHANGASTRAVADALRAGAQRGADAVGGVDVRQVEALAVDADQLADAAAVVFATAEHFGTMSGGLKHAFDTTYGALRTGGVHRPYVLVVKAGDDGTGTVRDVTRICTGLGWREARPPLLLVGELTDLMLADVEELGATVAAGVSAGAL
ncbi:MAG: hypothetical protein ACI970_000771 [Myxococcota bacterium]|jgi:hypothetical protein